MKKLFAALIVAAVMAVGAFAEDSFPTGSWIDSNYDAEWVFGVNGSVELHDAVTGDLIFKFTKDQIKDYRLLPSADGFTLSFECPATHRKYKFSKPISLSTDLIMEIDPDWSDKNYKVNIKFKK
ncbi:MAG: hypothetical protein MJ160_01530 [Treponema sp.]|nr:hypothetical protein [Treponema sp.]